MYQKEKGLYYRPRGHKGDKLYEELESHEKQSSWAQILCFCDYILHLEVSLKVSCIHLFL